MTKLPACAIGSVQRIVFNDQIVQKVGANEAVYEKVAWCERGKALIMAAHPRFRCNAFIASFSAIYGDRPSGATTTTATTVAVAAVVVATTTTTPSMYSPPSPSSASSSVLPVRIGSPFSSSSSSC